jgi:hypothetical protein
MMIADFFRTFLWRRRMNKVCEGMTASEVEKRLGQPPRKMKTEKVEIWSYDLDRIKGMVHSIRVAFMDGRVNQVYIGIEALEDASSVKKPSPKPAPEPFMEHPDGGFENALEAMEDAVRRLRALPKWDQWIEFCAQGEDPARPGTIKFAAVRLLGDKLDVGDKALDLDLICRKAGLARSVIAPSERQYLISSVSPKDVAVLFDAIFQHHFGIQPFVDEGNDYSIGAEW